MDGVMFFRAFQLHGVEGHQTSSLPCGAHTEGGTRSPVTCVARNIDIVLTQVGVVDGRQTFTTDHEGFDGIKSHLVFLGPSGECVACLFCCQWCQDAGEICEFW